MENRPKKINVRNRTNRLATRVRILTLPHIGGNEAADKIQKMNTARQLAIYLNVKIADTLPDGEYRQPMWAEPAYRPDRDTEDAEKSAERANATIHDWAINTLSERCTPGSAVAAIAAEVGPSPESASPYDRAQNREDTLRHIVECWPEMPRDDHAMLHALNGRIWLSQGSDWEYIDIDACAVVAAIKSGKTAAEIKSSIAALEPTYIEQRRAARNGDKAERR